MITSHGIVEQGPRCATVGIAGGRSEDGNDLTIFSPSLKFYIDHPSVLDDHHPYIPHSMEVDRRLFFTLGDMD